MPGNKSTSTSNNSLVWIPTFYGYIYAVPGPAIFTEIVKYYSTTNPTSNLLLLHTGNSQPLLLLKVLYDRYFKLKLTSNEYITKTFEREWICNFVNTAKTMISQNFTKIPTFSDNTYLSMRNFNISIPTQTGGSWRQSFTKKYSRCLKSHWHIKFAAFGKKRVRAYSVPFAKSKCKFYDPALWSCYPFSSILHPAELMASDSGMRPDCDVDNGKYV